MKFTVMLIYTLAATLLLGLFGTYVYLAVIGEQTGNPSDITAANTVLFLFALAVITVSLTLIWLENLPDETPQSPLDKYIAETREEEMRSTCSAEQIEPILQKLNQISQSLSHTNKTLNLGLERLSTRIDEVENTALEQRLDLKTGENEKDNDTQTQQKLTEIFNDDLAKTLAGLEIMNDGEKPQTKKIKYRDVDLDTLLNNLRNK